MFFILDKTTADNIIKQKSFSFAIRIAKLYQSLCAFKREYVLSKQLLRTGTAGGVLIRETEYAESKVDLKHKLGIARKKYMKAFTGLNFWRKQGIYQKNNFKASIKTV